MLTTQSSDLWQSYCSVFAGRPSCKRSDWVAENIRLSPLRSPFAGPFSFGTHAYAREPIDAMDDDEVRQIVLMWATQLGKGDTTFAMLWSQSEISPSPSLFVGTDQDYVREQRDRFFAMGLSSPTLKKHVPRKVNWNMNAMDLQTMRVYLAWSGSAQRVSGRSVMTVLYSEADQSQAITGQASPTQLAEERVKAWFDLGAKIIWEGTPTHEQSFMASKYEASDRREFNVPCPHCGKMQVLRHHAIKTGSRAGRGGIGNIRDKHGVALPDEEVRDSARYVCLEGCEWTNSDRLAALPHGVWLPRGVRLSRKEQDGEAVRVNGVAYRKVGEPESKAKSIRGYHLNSLYAWSLSIGDNAVKLLESERDPEARVNFINNWQAEKKLLGRRRLKADEFAMKREGDYRRGQVPPQAYFLTMAADVQASQVFWSVRAWGQERTSWLIDWGHIGDYQSGLEDADIDERVSDNLRRLLAIAKQQYPVDGESVTGHEYLGVRMLGIDSNYHPTPVLDLCAGAKSRTIVPIIGQEYMASGRAYWTESVEVDRRGKAKHKLMRWRIAVDVYKDDLRNHLWPLTPGEFGAWYLPADVRECGVDYLKQVLNEEEIIEIQSRTNRKKRRWKVITPAIGNHYWDTEVYNRALADIVTERDWDLDSRVNRAGASDASAQQQTEFSAI